MKQNFLKKLWNAIFRSDDMQAEGTQRDFTGGPEVITFCKADFKYIDVGMYLFTDNTFSSKLQEGKTVRGVVLKTFGKSVFVLLPEEQNLVYERERDYREFAPQLLFSQRGLCILKRMPCLDVLQSMHWFKEDLNKSLKEAGQPEIKGLYWSWAYELPYFRYDPEKGEKLLITKACCAKARFVLEMRP